MTIAEGHYWGGTPFTQATTHWGVPALSGIAPLGVDRGTFIVRQWAETTNGAGNGGMCFQNTIAVGNGSVWGRAPHSMDGTGDFWFGNSSTGAIGFTEPALLTDYHTLMFSASTGDGDDPAGMRVFMDAGKVLATRDTWSGAKPDYSVAPWLKVGRGFWGVISYLYVFDAYITDVGFCEQFWEQPFYFFAEATTVFSIPTPATVDTITSLETVPRPLGDVSDCAIFSDITLTADWEFGSREVTIFRNGLVLSNAALEELAFVNGVDGVLAFEGTGLMLSKANVPGVFGHYLGWTLQGEASPFRIEAVEMEYQMTRAWDTSP